MAVHNLWRAVWRISLFLTNSLDVQVHSHRDTGTPSVYYVTVFAPTAHIILIGATKMNSFYFVFNSIFHVLVIAHLSHCKLTNFRRRIPQERTKCVCVSCVFLFLSIRRTNIVRITVSIHQIQSLCARRTYGTSLKSLALFRILRSKRNIAILFYRYV